MGHVHRRRLAAAVAAAFLLPTLLVGASTASADTTDVPPTNRVSCPSLADAKRINGLFVSRSATASTCTYAIKDSPEVAYFTFYPGVKTVAEAQKIEEDRASGTGAPPWAPLPALGPDARYSSDFRYDVYWQVAPGMVGVLMGPGLPQRWDLPQATALAKSIRPMMEVYTVPGTHKVNGRTWRVACEQYSTTYRCRTDIQATQIIKTTSGYKRVDGWAFNSLTYRWSERSQWKNNPLGHTGTWTSPEGRKWRTECDTKNTGTKACRSYIYATVFQQTPGGIRTHTTWVFNNQVLFI